MLRGIGRGFAYILIGLLLTLMLAFTLLPLAVRWGVAYWFDQHGMTAQLQHVSLAPAVGRIELAGLSASRDGVQQLNVDDMLLDIDLLPLLDNRLQIADFKVRGLFLNTVSSDQNLSIAGLDINALVNSENKTKVEGSGAVAVENKTPQPFQVMVKNLAIEETRVCSSAEKASAKLADLCLSWSALTNREAINLKLANELSLSIPGALQLSGLHLDDNLQQLSVVKWSMFSLSGVQYAPPSITLDRIDLKQLQLLQRDDNAPLKQESPAHVQLAGFNASQLLVELGDETNVSLQQLMLGGVEMLILRDGKRIALQRRIDQLLASIAALTPVSPDAPQQQSQKQSQNHSQKQTQEPEGATRTVIELQKLVINDSSRIVYLDTQVQPQVEQRLNNLTLSFGPINTASPDQPSEVSLAIDVNEFSKLSMAGWVKPLTEKLNMEVGLQVDGYDPLAVSPYVERALQYKIQRGQLHNTLEIAITDDQLDIDSELILEKFYLKDLKPEELAEGEKAQTLPVATAMNLLRDGDDRITIKLPITGDIADPSFSLSQVVGIVMKKALTQAVINYYTPFGLVNIASALADSATQLRFEPMALVAGQVDLGKEHNVRLQQLASLLQARQKLSLSFCPSVTAADALSLLKLKQLPEQGVTLTAEQQQQLRQLGIDRGRTVKSTLLDYGVTPSQVILCQANVDLAEQGMPGINISL